MLHVWVAAFRLQCVDSVGYKAYTCVLVQAAGMSLLMSVVGVCHQGMLAWHSAAALMSLPHHVKRYAFIEARNWPVLPWSNGWMQLLCVVKDGVLFMCADVGCAVCVCWADVHC